MKSFALAAAVGVASAFEFEDMFKFTTWMADYGKSYNSADEFEFRITQFLIREAAILEHNAGEHNFTMGHNDKSDWSSEEFKTILTYVE